VAEIQSINYPLHPCRLAQWLRHFTINRMTQYNGQGHGLPPAALEGDEEPQNSDWMPPVATATRFSSGFSGVVSPPTAKPGHDACLGRLDSGLPGRHDHQCFLLRKKKVSPSTIGAQAPHFGGKFLWLGTQVIAA